MPAKMGLKPPVKKFRKRCRYCHRLFETDAENAKFCPGTTHKWLFWDRAHPRKGMQHARR